MSPGTWVMLPKKVGGRRIKYFKRSDFQTVIRQLNEKSFFIKVPFVSNNTMKILIVLFISYNKMKLFFFFTHFVLQIFCKSLRNFILVSDIAMKTSTAQKWIICSELIYVWVTIQKALFVSIATKCSTQAFHTLLICTQWEWFRSQPASRLALSCSETSLTSLNLRLRIIKALNQRELSIPDNRSFKLARKIVK